MDLITGILYHPYSIEIILKDEHKHPTAQVKRGGAPPVTLFVFQGRETVAGSVIINIHENSNIEHSGIKIELVGQVDIEYERSSTYQFTSLVRELEFPGIISGDHDYPFEFSNVEKPFETYWGSNAKLRYFLIVKIGRPLMSITKQMEFLVQNPIPDPLPVNPIKMEVGIEDCLHLEFEYNKSKYHLNDVVIGKIYFLLIKIKVKHMELQILRKETTGCNTDSYSETEVLTKFEIMDGAPMRGESIPIRFFLAPFNLTPTFPNVHHKFSVKYYLNLVLVDEEDRRYFKQQEMILWRKDLIGVDFPSSK